MGESSPGSTARKAALLGGVILLGAALWVAMRRVDIHRLGQANPLDLGLIGLGVLANLLVTGLLVWSITRRFKPNPPISPGTMIGLVTASHLLNYLPFRPGFVGRAAYLRSRHGVALRHSALVLGVVLVIGTIVSGTILATAAILGPPYRTVAMAVALAAVSVAGPALARAVLGRATPSAWAWVPLRCLDVLAGGLRLWAAFRIVGPGVDGQEIGFDIAVIAVAAGSVVAMVGLTPNGLGLREWAVAITAELVEPGTLAAAGLGAAIDRAVEAIVVTVGGLWSIRVLGLKEAATKLDAVPRERC